jgi:uroporphyrin-III C-methyltransferase / precorrin-2 dehydrogenase / sirohydrochlorin ferrochelatase
MVVHDEFPAGTVALVGAGPGHPDLLTRRAVKRLEAADVVFYDALVDPEVLTLAGRAQRIYVGKRAGRPAVRQSLINQLLVRAARRGRRVVRLKGGDPFVFGRGGEEALALLAAGIAFELVPGITTAVAAPELAGIPVTHRGASTAFVVVSGHAPAGFEKILQSLPPQSATVVVLMGLAAAPRIAAVLAERGWSTQTPAAVIRGASTADAEVWMGTIADLPAGAADSVSDRPGTIVIGEVVRVGALLAGDIDYAADAGRLTARSAAAR